MSASGSPTEITAVSLRPALQWPAALAAVTGSVLVGFMPLIALQLYKAGISAPSMLVWRYGLALVPLTAAAAARHGFRAALRGGAWRISLVGATLGAGQTLCFWESLHTIDTSIAILLFYTYPALTLGLDRLIFKRPIRWRAALCVAMILLGAGLVALPGLHGGGIDPRGLAWILPSPLIYALYLAANSVLMRPHPPLIGAVFLYLGLAASFAGASLYLGLDVPARASTWLLVLLIALGPGALTVTLFSYSVPRLGPASYAVIANCELLTVILIGVLALGEKLTMARLIGAGLILSGILSHGLLNALKRR
ncbi:MAG TPA: DMT family transporter [Stellaceae bacterium]|jgi:drug/metabolite transporter (DMT)-like permease|nr:DMT family transporter [Stellaceae bacterium]